MYRRVEIVQVAQDKAGGVADPPVDIGQLIEDIWGDADIAPEIGGGNPQPQNICAVLLPDFFRSNDVAQGLGHLIPFPIHHHTVGEHRPVGSLALGGHRHRQGGLEPAPVLIAAL